MEQKIEISKEELKNFKVLDNNELEKLNFHELCLYLSMLELAEKIMEGCDS